MSSETGTERRILEAATALFYEKGYHGTTMREVAAAVGIKAGSLYNHFPGKEDLLFRIAHGTMEELLVGGREATAAAVSASERLRALVVWHVVYHAEKRFQARVADEQLHALGPERRDAVLQIRDEYTGSSRRSSMSAGSRRGGSFPSSSLITFAIGGMCTFVDTWYRDDGPLTAYEIAEMYADFVLAGLRSSN